MALDLGRDMYDPTPPSTWFGRARFTPARDVLRGVLSARLDPRTLIAAADLPAPLPTLVYTVVKRSRLWRREKLDVARSWWLILPTDSKPAAWPSNWPPISAPSIRRPG